PSYSRSCLVRPVNSCVVYCCGDHRDLPSFPTRRSSDLAGLIQDVKEEVVIPGFRRLGPMGLEGEPLAADLDLRVEQAVRAGPVEDRKSTRLNSSHVKISYAVFCLKKKNKSNKSTSNSDS